MTNKFISDPREVVKAGDIVKVKVLEVDTQRKRISFTMRMDDTPAPQAKGSKPGGKPAKSGAKPKGSNSRGQGKPSSQGNSAMGNAFADAFAKAKQK